MKKGDLYTIINFIILASLDNAALALIPAINVKVASGLGITDDSLIFLTVAIVTFVTAATSFVWGYFGDKYSRKKMLLYGSILWSVFILLSGFATNFWMLFIFQLCAGFGLGSIASVGFSIIVDFVSPQRRGLALSLWGMSQGVGSFIGYGIAIVFATSMAWNAPFIILAIIEFGFIGLFFFTTEPKRGATEEELQGQDYDFIIKKEDLRYIFNIRTNKYLIFQGLFAQVVWGALQVLPGVFTHKLLAQGVSVDPATVIGGIIAGLFQLGAIFSILFGWIGDKYHKKTLSARPIISAIGVFIGIPLFIGALLVPFQLSAVPNTSNILQIINYLLFQIVFNPLFLIVFFLAFFAAVCMSADSPNFFALVGDINLPEHRGTMFGFSNFINGLGRSIGLILIPVLVISLGPVFPDPTNWVISMVVVQLFFIPTGIFYALAAKSAPKDILNVKAKMKERADSSTKT